MVLWNSPRYATEDLKVISDAIGFTKIVLHQYYGTKYAGASQFTHEIINKQRKKIEDDLNEIWGLIGKEPHATKWIESERLFVFSKLGSALNLYLIHLNDENTMYPLPESQNRIKNVNDILKSPIFQGLDTHIYDKYYISKQETIPNHLFFSYNINDKEIVGKISKILESKYGYTIFRAHDTIPGGKIWRDTLRENLTKCEGLVAYVTENFLSSFYAHQECGWVMARKNIPIFPLFLTDTKPGLLEEWQGKPIEGSPDPNYVAELINDAFKNPS